MYELLITTLHCMARMEHVVGTADAEAEARAWATDGGTGKSPFIPKEDPAA